MHDEALVLRTLRIAAEASEPFDHPRLDPVSPAALRGAEAGQKLARIRRPVASVVHVQRTVVAERVGFVGHRGVDPLGEEARTPEVRRAERDAVHAREIPGTETGGIAVDEARAAEAFRLRLVERDERRAARIADEHDPLVAAAAEELHARAEILDR